MPDDILPSQHNDKLDFSCKAGQAIAIYADENVRPMRFWIAESIKAISKPETQEDEDILFPIYYFAAIEDNHLIYEPEYTPKKRTSVKYAQCLGTVSPLTHKNNVIEITAMERDRLQSIALAEDNAV